MPFAAHLDLGMMGERLALASLYSGSSGQCVVVCGTSYMPNASVTCTTSATGPLTMVDAFGNTSAVVVSNGRVSIPLAETPTYLRLPAGVTVSAYRVNDWPPVSASVAWRSSGPLGYSLKAGQAAICDDGLATNYATGAGSAAGPYGLPDTAGVAWPTAARFDRVIAWCGSAWQASHALLDFDVQTSNDGSTWTTQATVTKQAPSSFLFGTDSSNVWCTRETFWDEQWVFDVPLPAPVTARYLRLYVRSTSYGGEPDAAAASGGGQGDSQQRIVLQEVSVMCDNNTKPQWVVT